MKRIFLTLLPLSLSTLAVAQTWNEAFVNQPQNVRYESRNPTRLAYNQQQDFAVAEAGYSMEKGDLHAIDRSGNASRFGGYIGGLRKIGGFNLAGHIRYVNEKDREQSWNSTLWNLADNPFVLCDSVPGDATTESFDMLATAAYSFSPRLKAGLELGLRTGHRADQNDPRPRTTNAIIPITAGIDYQLGQQWTLGLSAGVRLQSSVIEYTTTISNVYYRFFLMKGMGDYAKRTTSDSPGYYRDYKGNSYNGAVNVVWQSVSGNMSDMLELSFDNNNQDATDGATSYTFHGGDYTENIFKLHNRFWWRQSERMLHNITIDAALQNGKGTWYDQKRQTDLEHGNLVYYEILNKSVNHKNQRLKASLAYQLDMLNEGRRDLFIRAEAGMSSLVRKQLLGDATPKQEIQSLSLQLQAGKTIYINKVSLLAQIGGGYLTPQKQTYASGSVYTDEDNIDAVYTRRIFEYESAQCWNAEALVDASLPVGPKLTVGAYAGLRYRAYSGKNEYWQGYDGTRLTTLNAGLYIKF